VIIIVIVARVLRMVAVAAISHRTALSAPASVARSIVVPTAVAIIAIAVVVALA
jgi:hypothetical protein